MTNPASNALPERAVYKPPPDAFSWPQNAERGDDMVVRRTRRARSASGSGGPAGASSAEASTARAGASASASAASPPAGPSNTSGNDHDDRPPSVITLGVGDVDAHRGLPLRLRGAVRADGEPCAHVAVEVWLRDPGDEAARGCVAPRARWRPATTAASPAASSSPAGRPLGDYEVVARTPGDSRCGGGASN